MAIIMKKWAKIFSLILAMSLLSSCANKAIIDDPVSYSLPEPEVKTVDMTVKNTINVKDFGAVPNTGEPQDKAIREAIEAAIKQGPGSRVLFESGTYYIDSLTGSDLEPYNHNSLIPDQAYYHFYYQSVQGLTIEGDNTTLIFKDNYAGAFRFENSNGIAIKNLTIDYETMPWTQATVTKVDAENGAFECRVEADATDLLNDQRMINSMQVENNNNQIFGLVMDRENPVLLKKSANDFFFIDSYEKIGDREYRITMTDKRFINPNFVDVKDKITINNRGTTGSAIDVVYTANTYIDNVTVYASPGCGIIGYYGEGELIVNNFKLMRKPDSGRWISSNADGIHYQAFNGKAQITDCVFEGMSDDGINFYQVPCTVDTVVDESNLVVRHGAAVPQVGQIITVFDGAKGKVLGSAQVTEFTPNEDGTKSGMIALSNPIKGMNVKKGENPSITVYINSYAFDGCEIKNNTFREFRGRGIIARTNNTVIEGNQFIRTSSNPIVIQNFADSEGLLSNNMVIQQNTVDDCAYMEKFRTDSSGGQFMISQLNSSWEQSKNTGHKNMVISDNTIMNSRSKYGIYACNIDGLKITGNQISSFDGDNGMTNNKTYSGKKAKLSDFSGIYIKYSENVEISGNMINYMQPEVIAAIHVDSGCRNVSVDGNTIMVPYAAKTVKGMGLFKN